MKSMPTPSRKAKRKTIEPFDYTTAAQAPALKGMTSFLDLSPEMLRETNLLSREQPGVLTIPRQVSSGAGDRSIAVSLPRPAETSQGEITPEINKSPEDKTSPENERIPGDETFPEGVLPPADSAAEETSLGQPPATADEPKATIVEAVAPPAPNRAESPLPAARPEEFVQPIAPPEPVVEKAVAPNPSFSEALPVESEKTSGDVSSPGVQAHRGAYPRPGVGRSKIRRCVLAQDGHSLGEEAIYQILWKLGRPEGGNPNGARMICIGAADIGMRANMAKKNVRQNLSRLYEKLAIEVTEDFETVSSKPRTYRVYSYKQILERRRAAGLEYVLRNKGVVFCTEEGREIDLARRNETTPGDETTPRPAISKRQRQVERRISILAQAEPKLSDELEARELAAISAALNAHWTVDEEAAAQMLRGCRQVRSDARVDEIVFFIREKVELIRANHKITNPTGLLLATVPKSFAGKSFEAFRERFERQRSLAEEEQARKREEEEAMRVWLAEQIAQCEAVVNDPESSQQDRDRAEVRLRGFATWTL
jgi:hypothetical protein